MNTRISSLTSLLMLSALFAAAMAHAALVTSIAVTPTDRTIYAGETQAFTATGTYSDGTTQVLRTVAGLGLGSNHTCAFLASGALLCWGQNNYGQLGQGITSHHTTVPGPVSGIDGVAAKAIAVVGGFYHTCAVLGSGAVKCWGRNNLGQLGDGSTTNSSLPITVNDLTAPAVAIASGTEANHTCAILESGAVQCWGENNYGQLGDGSTTNSSLPVTVYGIDGSSATATAVAIAAGAFHTCAVLVTGTVKCWGRDHVGQLGDGNTETSSVPVTVRFIDDATAVAVGNASTCALLASGAVKCWGGNGRGELGDGTKVNRFSPSQVVGIDGDEASATAIAMGLWHGCATLKSGAMKCWGWNYQAQLGTTPYVSYSYTPVPVKDIDGIAAVAVTPATGDSFSCVVLASGEMRCWGSNGTGQTGVGTTGTTWLPATTWGILRWASSDPTVASVDVNGVVTGLSDGSTTISASRTWSGGLVTTGSTTLTVITNLPPVANAGPDQTVEATSAAGASVTLDGSASYDPDGDALSYNWSGPFGMSTGAIITETLPIGTSTVTLSVSDGDLSDSDSALITVQDTTPPVLTLPANMTVDADSPAGATVSYSATATDAADPNPTVTCTPASGSLFPTGTTTVNCTAVDSTGNSSTGSFTITVRTTAEMIENLYTLITEATATSAPGISHSLEVKLDAARRALESARPNSLTTACNQLDAFIDEVQDESGNQIPVDKANALISAAQQLQAALGC